MGTGVLRANLAKTGLAFEEIEGLVDRIHARQRIFFVDACHSGELDQAEVESAMPEGPVDGPVRSRAVRGIGVVQPRLGLQNSIELAKQLFADLRSSSGFFILSAARGLEYAYESDQWKNGVFTHALLEGLKSKGADLNKDGMITFSELRDYVIQKVTQLTGGGQTPTVRREKLDADVVIF